MEQKQHEIAFTSAILLAGGKGERMQSSIPKQFLPLGEKSVLEHSLEVFLTNPWIREIIIVCEEEYRHPSQNYTCTSCPIIFAIPGKRRQDSVFNGILASSFHSEFVCIHDSARPFITKDILERVLLSAYQHGAAIAAMPMKFTLKESTPEGFVHKTYDRSLFWEIQTPQIARKNLLLKGFEIANQQNLEVTDDAALIELTEHPIKIVQGSYKNLKITTPEDLQIAKYFKDANKSN